MLLILPANVDGTRWGLDSKTQLGVEMSKVFFQLTLVKNIDILIVIWVSRLQNPISPLCLLEGKVWALSMLKRFERTFQWSNGDHMLQDCTHLTIQFQSPVILQMINCYYFCCTNIRFKHAQYSKGCEQYLCASRHHTTAWNAKGCYKPTLGWMKLLQAGRNLHTLIPFPCKRCSPGVLACFTTPKNLKEAWT